MDYIGAVIRPPSEADSLILQVAVGCSHNRCTFCGTYKGRDFTPKPREVIFRDIDEAARSRIPFRRAFLPDGDALVLPTAELIAIISEVRGRIPSIERVGIYGNTKAILKKSPAELAEMRSAGLGIVYQGIESGNEAVLRRIRKGAFPRHMTDAARRVMDAGILLSQTVLLGAGGTDLSDNHARDTGRLLGDISPDYASALTLMVIPGTPLHRDLGKGAFSLPDSFAMLGELAGIIAAMDVHRPVFFSANHASNYLPVRLRLPDEKESTLRLLFEVIEKRDRSRLKPESFRRL